MDGFEEKKWFVYLVDHHEGPFSLSDMQAKMAQGQVSSANYVWAEGLTDWKPMTDVPAFAAILTPARAVPTNAPTSVASPPAYAYSASAQPLQTAEPMLTAEPTAFAEPMATAEPMALALPASSSVSSVSSANSMTAPPASVLLTEAIAIEPPEKTGTLDPADLQQAQAAMAIPIAEPVLMSHPSIPMADLSSHPISHPTSSPSAASQARAAQPNSSRLGFLLRLAVVILVPAGLASAYFNGSLDPVFNSPAVKAATQTAKDFSQPYLLKLTEKFPALAQWISPIPALEDVSPEDYAALKAAALQKPAQGAVMAVALSTADLFAPAFYVSSNLPEGAVIDLYIEGIPDTLLNQMSFSAKVQATIQKRLGKTDVVKSPDGKALPRGEYIVYATENPQQPDAVKAVLASIQPINAKTAPMLPKDLKLLVSKPVFLGGQKDAIYTSRLKEFHDKLHAKAAAELAELKQLETALESQLTQTTTKYRVLSGLVRGGKPSLAARKSWNDFNTQWSKFEDELKQSYAKWTDQALATEYFYGVLYSLTKSTGDTVDQLHQLQADFFNGKKDFKTFEIERGSAISVAQSAVANLKNKINQAESIAPTPNGMPRREGL